MNLRSSKSRPIEESGILEGLDDVFIEERAID